MKKTLALLVITGMILSACSGTSDSVATPSPTPTPSPTEEPEIVVDSDVVLIMPDQAEAVSSPMSVEGFAPGTWFFEGNIVGEVRAQSGEVLTTLPL
ncbi:MAG: hypothetical protein QG639_875, partial [Patescibacteria group bacterium]|nr:hypothetical protein [Patescibacteria group bacterium]